MTSGEIIVVVLGIASFALCILASILKDHEACQFVQPDRLGNPHTSPKARSGNVSGSTNNGSEQLVYTGDPLQGNGPAGNHFENTINTISL